VGIKLRIVGIKLGSNIVKWSEEEEEASVGRDDDSANVVAGNEMISNSKLTSSKLHLVGLDSSSVSLK